MKKIFSIIAIFAYLFGYSKIYANNFNARIDEQLVTVAGNPGKSYTVTINIETSGAGITAYPVSFDLPDQNTYSTTNTWLTPNVSSINIDNHQATSLSFSLTIPTGTQVGEYYKSVGISDTVYSENTDSVVISIPVIVQVTENGEESVTSDSSDSDTSTTSTSTTSTATQSTGSNNQTTTSTTPSPTSTNTKPKQTKKTTPTKTIDIFSKLILADIKTKFSPLKQKTKIDLKLKNEGNIYSIPSGSIQVRDSKNNPIKFFSLNPNKKIVKPNDTTNFNYQLDLPSFYLGFLKLDIYLSDTNTQTTTPLTLVKSTSFLHLDIIPIAIIILFLTLIVKNRSSKKTVLLLSLLTTISLGVCYHLSTKTTHQNYQSETTSLSVSATVKSQVGLRVISNDINAKRIMFVSTNTLGSRLFSLSGNTRSVLDEILTHTEINHVVNLTASQSAKPILMITSGY